jgi:hypothetical protein
MSIRDVPRGDMFADPSARMVWAAICILEEAAQHEILAALRERLALAGERETPHDVRIARAVAALREASDLLELGENLSVERYKRIREQHEDFGWPPEGSIRRWLGGSWNDALGRAGLEAVPDGDVTTYRLGSAITRDEVIAAVQACAREGDSVPTLSQYVFWAKQPAVRRRPGRRPLSQSAFDRLFGGWLPALIAAGLVDAEAPARAPSPGPGQVRPSGYRFTREQIRAALREIAELVGRSPRTAEYHRERARLLQAQDASGRPVRALPSYNVINDRYETWDDALVDAGLEPLGGRGTKSSEPRERRTSKRISDEEILDVLREAHTTVGDPFTTGAYTAWRAEQLKIDRANGRLRRLPIWGTISLRFGSWAAARQAAFGA